MNRFYTAASSTALLSYSPLSIAGAYAVPQELSSAAGVDYYGDIRAAADQRTCVLNFQSHPHFGVAISLASYFGPAENAHPLMSRADSILTALACSEPLQPANAVHAVNRAVSGLAGDSAYLTLFHAWVDPLRRELRYVSAGHEPATLLRQRRGRITQLEQTGTVLGLTARSNYGYRAIPLDAGDTLVIITSGIAETPNIHGSLFGTRGVVDVLRRLPHAGAASLVSAVLDETERHAGWAMRSSDHGIAVVRLLPQRDGKPLEEAEVEEPHGELAMAAA
jgi:sigma-B regulation protein RsbU (phosphoserine phosphatase)